MDRSQSIGARLSPCLLVFIALAGATHVFAQGQNGILTGTVTDAGGVVPGATVVATDPARPTSLGGVERPGYFPHPVSAAGRYSVQRRNGRLQADHANDVTLLSGETRDLGRLVLEVGTLAEAVTVTAEVTPVNTTSSSLQRRITGDQLTMIQVKGRDIFGMMKILPGVSDTTFSRDYASWQSGRGLSINGASSLNKNTTIDGVPVGEEGGDGTTHVTPNIDAIGEVTVITNGYTAENGRQSSGLIRIITKSGTNQIRGSGWYNARRDEWNANDYFRKKQGAEKPFFEVNFSGYSIGGPVVIPKLVDSRSSDKKFYFFLSQEFVDDVRPTSVVRTNLPTAAERTGDFSQTRITNGTLQVIIDPARVSLSRATSFRGIGSIQWARRCSTCCRCPTASSTSRPARSGRRTTRRMCSRFTSAGTRHAHRCGADQGYRVSMRMMFDRDDSTTYNRVAPGIGSVNNLFPGESGHRHVDVGDQRLDGS